ncbi:MAG: tetratricopeptide repeat protein, partial [Gemmataceae bacterium]|nr:tetratricopeptide repeat protein [Gemmataceae bacterium]
MYKRESAADLNAKGLALQKQGKRQEAIEMYLQAAAKLPSWATPYYHLGLLYKFEANWEKSLDYNLRATALDARNEAAWWNLGIAATALARWDVARAAWRGFGIQVLDGDGPVDLPCGLGPIRLNPDGDAEVVWAYRLDPARAEIVSIPFPQSKHRWGDVVLNDGAPVGYRKHDGKDVPVFNALQLLTASAFGTFVARVAMPNRSDFVAELAKIATDKDGAAEDWSTSTRILCKACSESRAHTVHDTKAKPPDGVHVIGVAAKCRAHASSILHAW